MRIEEVEAIKYKLDCVVGGHGLFRDTAYELIEVLRAEAWHPVEKAEELGAKDGRDVIVWDATTYWFEAHWSSEKSKWLDTGYGNIDCDSTHFRFINPPEGA